jgi:hypothetical protein
VIDGTFSNFDDGSALVGWTVQLEDFNGRTQSLQTDASGRYAFFGLAAGVYTVCAEVQEGWIQELPMSSAPCLNGMGYTFTLAEADVASGVDFLMRR